MTPVFGTNKLAASSESHPQCDQRWLELLDQVLSSPQEPSLPADLARVPLAVKLYEQCLELRRFSMGLFNGELDQQLKSKGFVAGAFKGLQANLRHLSWQTQVIASGDFSQRVDFMGEFSRSFNSMVKQLDHSLKLLQEKEAALVQEIQERKNTEEALRASEERYRQLATTDSLTGLYNRRHFFHLAEREMARAMRYSHPLAVIIMDLDHFKQVNDTHGHAAGDEILKEVAGLAQSNFRASDILARYGGEEFIFLMPETDPEAATAAAERLRQDIAARSFAQDPAPLKVTASMGLCCHHDGEHTPQQCRQCLEAIISLADKALYQAKEAGRNTLRQAQ
ncbi:MAG: GGDEF domain-containing protein [Desulfarculaceae bacterium]|nr:GGDEF domain-containing protein [Desulfarculaceae bacterium]